MKAEGRSLKAEQCAGGQCVSATGGERKAAGGGTDRKLSEVPKEQTYLTRADLARVLRVSIRKVDSMIAGREIPVLRLGKAVRFRWEEVERVLSKRTEQERLKAEGC